MERYIVIDNVCGWPKLTLMDDGSINLDVHNKPFHGSADGSAECWKSVDGGKIFEFYGVSGKGSLEEGCYGDKVCGVAHNGDYIVIVQNCTRKETVVFRSKDGGKTFEETGLIESGRVNQSNHGAMPFPFGIIQRLSNKTLVFHYWMNSEKDWDKGYADAVHESHIAISHDDGYTWNEDYMIDTGINESAILFYDDMHGIAVGRIDAAFTANEGSQRDSGGGNRIYRTLDGGKTWNFEGNVWGQGMIPAHLIKLNDGNTLMTFGYRFANQHGVMASISKDEGRTWNEPNILVQYSPFDGGYPSSVQLADGTIVTAYYSKGNIYHTRYHVGVIRWKLSELLEGRWINRPAKFFYGTDTEFIEDWRL